MTFLTFVIGLVISLICYRFVTYYLMISHRAMEYKARDERNKRIRAQIQNARAMRVRLKPVVGTSLASNLNLQ